jgi:ribonuclease HI
MRRENFQDRNRGFSIMRRRGPMLEKIKLSSTLQKDHINLLEMRAVLLALSHFKLCLESLSIVLATDNTTVVAYLKKRL